MSGKKHNRRKKDDEGEGGKKVKWSQLMTEIQDLETELEWGNWEKEEKSHGEDNSR